jgi:hypothetical protein
MNSLAVASEYPQTLSAAEPETRTPSAKPKLRVNGYLAMFSLAGVLALATASECSSITHLPSLMYGAVFWLWWAGLAAAMWKLSKRFPLVTSFSPATICAHLSIGSALGVIHLLLLGGLGFTDA